MTSDTPLRDICSNDPDTPIRLLGAYCHIEFPQTSDRTPAWERALHLAEHNLQVTIRFAGGQAVVLDPEGEKYDTIMKASAEASEALLTIKSALKSCTPLDFHLQIEKLRAQYASIVGHVTHFFFIDPATRPLMALGFIEKAL